MVHFTAHNYNRMDTETDRFAHDRNRSLQQIIAEQFQQNPKQFMIPTWEEPKVKKIRKITQPDTINPVVPSTTTNTCLSTSIPQDSVGIESKRRGRPPKNAKKVAEVSDVNESNKMKEKLVAKWRGEFVPKESERAKALKQQALESKLAAQKVYSHMFKEPPRRATFLSTNLPTPPTEEQIRLARAKEEEEEKRYKRIQNAKLRKIELGAKKRTEEKAIKRHVRLAQKHKVPLVLPAEIPVASVPEVDNKIPNN